MVATAAYVVCGLDKRGVASGLVWNNEHGWRTDLREASHFTDFERATAHFPHGCAARWVNTSMLQSLLGGADSGVFSVVAQVVGDCTRHEPLLVPWRLDEAACRCVSTAARAFADPTLTAARWNLGATALCSDGRCRADDPVQLAVFRHPHSGDVHGCLSAWYDCREYRSALLPMAALSAALNARGYRDESELHTELVVRISAQLAEPC